MTDEQINITALVRDGVKIMKLLGVAEAADVLPELKKRLAAEALAQQPVQARDFRGWPWWLHGCGAAWAASGTPRVKCPGCDHNDKPWRPLLVGGDPVPEQPSATEMLDELSRATGVEISYESLCALRREREARTEVERLKLQVNAEIEQADEHADWATKLAHAAIERLDVPITEEAHTELWEVALDALKAPVRAAEPGIEEYKALTGRLARERDEARAQIVQLSRCESGPDGVTCIVADSAHRDLYHGGSTLADVATTLRDAEPGPVVLTLPQVPEGAVALIGVKSGHRYTRLGESLWDERAEDGKLTLAEVLDFEPDGVRVEMAPPREPRTWPKLDSAPGDVRKVRVKYGNGPGFVVTRRRDNLWAKGIDRAPGAVDRDQCYHWGQLLELGELVEVFDDEPGNRP